MGILKLHELINLNRDEIIRRCGATAAPQATENWMDQGAAAILDQLMVELRDGLSRTEAINEAVMPRGDVLQSQKSTVSQVAQPYGGVGRSIVDLALELNIPLGADDFVTLDRCLDAAIAHSVTQHVSRQKIASGRAVNKLQDLTDTAIAAFEVLQTGTVGVIGRTGTLVRHSLIDIKALSEHVAQ
jgi:hypothetical protein